MTKTRFCAPLLAFIILFAPALALPQNGGDTLSTGLRSELEDAVERGLDFLRAEQQPDGSWEHDPGITGLAVTAFLRAPNAAPGEIEPAVRRGLDYVASMAKADGGIYVRDLPNYYTAVAIQALVASGDPRYRPLIDDAREFLVGLQVDEGEGYAEDNMFYGGIGYGSDLRPDMANMEYALSALSEAALPDDHPAWERALTFLQRAQNRSESNDLEWSRDDGGFVYYPGFSYAGGTTSYGSMTYAGLLSYAHANLTKDDERVQAALAWIRNNYTVEENPGLAATTLYYYYMVFAKALHTFDEDVIVDDQGVAHNWREDLGLKLLELQYDEGYWVNAEDPSYWQDNKSLVTAFTLQALEHLLAR